MKFGQPLLTTELSGSIGGATASSARGSVNYFRVRRRPSNPRSYMQSTVRLALNTLASAWRTVLTQPQRDAWTALATETESGIDVFVRCGAQPAVAGEPYEADAPVSPSLPFDPIPSIVVDASARTVTLPANLPGDIDANFYISAPQSQSRLSQQFPFRFAANVNAGGDVATIPVGHPAYNLVAGQVVYVKIVAFGATGDAYSGQVAIPQIFRAIVVA